MNEALGGGGGSFLSVEALSPLPNHGVSAISATEIRRLECDEPAVAVTTVGCAEPPSKSLVNGGRLEARRSSFRSPTMARSVPWTSRR